MKKLMFLSIGLAALFLLNLGLLIYIAFRPLELTVETPEGEKVISMSQALSSINGQAIERDKALYQTIVEICGEKEGVSQ